MCVKDVADLIILRRALVESANLKLPFAIPPWDTVIAIADALPMNSWILVGGLMTQAHAILAGHESRATHDIDLLIDVMSDTSNISVVMSCLQDMGFELQEPGLRGTAFHRMRKDGLIADVLIADHLPKGKASKTKVNRWPMMEIAGGAQAVSRKMTLNIEHSGGTAQLCMPNTLGALILKAAAYCTDHRDRQRHLDDVALLSSLIVDHKAALKQLHGSDRKRLQSAAYALSDPNNYAWITLSPENRKAGQLTLHILTS